MKKPCTSARMLLAAFAVAMILAAAGCGTTAGPQGPEGSPGDDGNANVVAAVADFTNADWGDGVYVNESDFGSAQRGARVIELDVPDITQDVFDLGMVHVYLKVPRSLGGAPVAWAPLPYQYLAGTFHHNYAFTYETGTLTLYYFRTANDDDATFPPVSSVTLPDTTFKYVIATAHAIEALADTGIEPSNAVAVEQHLAR